ncbi:MAG: RNA-guided pseudouridylation complex pseudouridine synthase subunit Cbf5 [Methanobacteriota archaeon]|nr:MAG: RNA-guided pseudouridylation complex pseudouridine synthase subunit Cbf5 [Euryarchaeota archaeon]
MGELIVLQEPPESRHGRRPADRSIAELLRLGVFIADKPQGPSSHQVSAWVRDLLGLPRAGHAGTLDPRVTGVLPIALADATRAVDAMLEGDKEYVGVLQLHQDVDEARVRGMMERFRGEVYQTPPLRSAVKRERRSRWIYELDPLEFDGRLALFRARCESGTYIRTLCNDIGEALGVGGHMLDLRRTRTATFPEADAHSLLDLKDAHVAWKEEDDEAPLRRVLQPMENLLRHLPQVVVKDTAVDAICHGSNLAVPGVAKLSPGIRRGNLVAVVSLKGEGVSLATAMLTSDEIVIAKSGIAADTKRVLMEPGTYPKLWK